MRLKTQPVIALDLLRLIAAFMVVGYHLGFRAFSNAGYLLNDLSGGHAELEVWWPLTWFGWVGVQMFFVISGFVIAFSSEGATPKKFITSRVLRLVPGMWVCVLVCGILAATWGIALDRVLWLSAKTALFIPFGPWIAGQVWTIAIELAFYSVVLLLLWRNAFERLEWVAIALTAASASYWALLTSGFVVDHAGRITQLLLLQHGCYFALGLLIWVINRKGASAARLLECAVCAATAWFQIDATLIAEDPGYGLQAYPIVPYVAWLSLIALMAAGVFWNSRLLSAVPSFVPPLTRTAGVMTYSLYLLHYHVGGTVLMAASGLSDSLALSLAVVASVIAAYVSAKLLEPLINKPLKDIFEGGWAAIEKRRTAPVKAS